MKIRQEIVEDLIVKLSFSSLPPFVQEQVISNISNISDEDLLKIIQIIDNLGDKETEYLEQTDKYINFYKELSKHIKLKLIDETVKMQEELSEELIKTDLE